MIHYLKILPKYFTRVSNGEKTAEIRINDRDFQAGDDMTLQYYDPEDPKMFNEPIYTEITHVLSECPGIDPGYCMISFKIQNK
jgi:hypothetical protein